MPPVEQDYDETVAHDDATSTADSDAATMVGEGASSYQRIEQGSVLGGYELGHRLGAGGMGEVFAARKPGGAQVALKVLSDINSARLYRFKREFRAIADVKHENLIALDQLVVLPSGQAFFTMELVDGVSFVEYVRGTTVVGQPPNLVRLERALRQLIEGVHALHLARCVHRDIKPSNILVTREGRVVLLDFGVISELSEGGDEGLTRDGQMMGTPAYMAPEQTGSAAAGPPADFYAIGIMLFECLTGTLPFTGTVLDILMDKRHGRNPDPAERLHASVTRDDRVEALLDLCRRALAAEPEQRPGHKDFLAALGDASETSAGATVSSAAESRSMMEPTFVGRQAELTELSSAFERVRSQVAPVTVHLRGASGQGKSALVGQFLARQRRRESVVILRGRCLERESVPYKGIDAVVDALSIYLRRLDDVESARLQPRHIAPLLQLFPVLGDAWPEGGRAMELDPGELRRRGLAGLREVLARVGERRPLIVHVDDFQWADVDSARLVTELMRPPDPPPMLLVISFRDEVGEREALQLLTAKQATEGRDVRELTIGPLSNDEARELAVALMRERDPESTRTDAADVYARRAQGNPFYIGQMVLGDDEHISTDASLDRLVARRIMALDPSVQQLLGVVAVAAGPTPVSVVLHACGIEESELPTEPESSLETLPEVRPVTSPEIEALLEANLLRRHNDGRIESAHDRIRVVAVGELSPEQLREAHLGLGEAFELLGGGESEALAEHFALGGNEQKALQYTERAAADAAAALAFDRAAQLYRRALALLGDADPARRRTLELALAEQLVDLGRGAAAAAMFDSLAASAEQPEQARELRRRAASELVKAGYLDEGMEAITPVLREVGVWQPRGVATAIIGTLWNRLLLTLRGYGFTQRQAADVSPHLLERIDSLLATKTGLSHHEAIFAGYQQSRAIRLALRAGEARRLIRCLVHDAAIFVAIGRREKGRGLMDVARRLVASVEEPEYHRVIEYVGANHRDHSGDWVGAAEAFEQMQGRLDESPNSGWIRGASTVQWMWVRRLLGRFGVLRAELPERVATARDLGVRHEQISLSSLWALTMAIYGDFEPALRLVAELQEQWHPRQLTFQHIIIALTEVEVALLDGRPQRAVEAAEAVLHDTRARIVAEMMPSHVDFYELRSRSRIRLALADIDVPRSLELVRRDLVRLRKSHKPQVGPQALIIDAALRSCEGDAIGAVARWREAASLLESRSMAAHLAVVRVRLAEHAGDAKAGQLAQNYFDDQGITSPQRMVDWLAPARATKS